MTSAEANRQVHHRLEIPAEATDVHYWSTVWHSEADFTISEAAFVAWCRARGWSPQPIHPDHPAALRLTEKRGQRVALVTDGLSFVAIPGDFGYRGVFDRRLARACVSFSTR